MVQKLFQSVGMDAFSNQYLTHHAQNIASLVESDIKLQSYTRLQSCPKIRMSTYAPNLLCFRDILNQIFSSYRPLLFVWKFLTPVGKARDLVLLLRLVMVEYKSWNGIKA